MITLKNVTLRRSAKVLLEGASVALNPGEKVGLVGRNGAGKSSLFALLNGNLHEDAGEYYIPAQWRMGQVAQDMPETPPPIIKTSNMGLSSVFFFFNSFRDSKNQKN